MDSRQQLTPEIRTPDKKHNQRQGARQRPPINQQLKPYWNSLQWGSSTSDVRDVGARGGLFAN